MSHETNEAAKQSVTDCNHLGNAAKIREALDKLLNFLRWVYAQDYPVSRDKLADAIDVGVSALAAPPRNCDRPECATTKAAQDVWRKEDGGKTAYYEWLLAPHHRPRGHGYERPGARARADDRARVLA